MSLKRGSSVLIGGAFERLFCPEGREFEQANLQKFKCPGGCRGGMLNFLIDRRISPVAIKFPRWALGYSYKGTRFGVAALLAKVSVALVSRQHRRKTERLYC